MAKFDIKKFAGIMIFYMILTFLIGPVIGYYSFGKTVDGAGMGFVIGSISTILLWQFFGKKMF